MEEVNETKEMNAIKEVNATKEAKKAISKLGLNFLLGTIIIYCVQFAVEFLVNKVRPEWLEDPTISLITSMMPMYLIGMPALIALVKRLPATKLPKRKMKVGHFLIAYMMCYAIIYGSNLLGTVLTTLIGALKGSAVSNQILEIATSSNMVVTFIYMVLCAPFFEEYIFRKLIVDRTVRFGEGVAIVLSGVMFGLFHGNLSQFIYATALGMFLAFLYVKTGKLKITIGIHMIVNFFGGIVSVWLLEGIHYDELLAVTESGNEQLMLEYMAASLPGWIVYMVYAIALLCIVIAGAVLMIVFRKRFQLVPGEAPIPKGERFKTIFLNTGMIIYCIFWIIMIILQLIM